MEYILSYATEEILGFSFRRRIVSFTWRFQKLETRATRLLVNFVQTYTAPLECDTIGFRCQFNLLLLDINFSHSIHFLFHVITQVGSKKCETFPSPSGKTVSCPQAIDYANKIRIQLHEETERKIQFKYHFEYTYLPGALILILIRYCVTFTKAQTGA